MRIVFMGTPSFAVPSLSALHGAGHEIVLVVTQPDRPSGRGRKISQSAVKSRALELGLEVFQPERVRSPEAVEAIKAAGPEVIVVAAFGQILPKSVLDIPPHGCINVHASILPKYRGAAPINWAIINGEDKTGVTIMQMDEGMDTGAMLLVGEEKIRPDDTAGSLTGRLSGLGAALVTKCLEKLEKSELRPTRQDDRLATKAPMLKKENGRIDWSVPATVIERLVRGLDPWPGSYAEGPGGTLRIWGSRVYDTVPFEGGAGEVVDVGNNGIKVMTGDGVLEITEVQAVGGRRMSVRDYLAGHKVQEGERFS